MGKMGSSQKIWSFEELRNLCAAKGLPDSKIYQEALLWKKERALYHEEEYQKIWAELFSSHATLTVGSEEWNKAQFASEAHVEAAAQVLHSMGEVLAQIINKAVLSDELKEDAVSMTTVRDKLAKKQGTGKISQAINKFQNSAEFKYINAFVNIIKHRRLLDRVFHAEGGENKRNAHGVCFLEFRYKGNLYPFTWATDIIDQYKICIFELIQEIGNAVNDYLRRI